MTSTSTAAATTSTAPLSTTLPPTSTTTTHGANVAGSSGPGGHTRKYLCAAPRPEHWEECGATVLAHWGDPTTARTVLTETIDRVRQLHQSQIKRRHGPGRKSNTEHAIFFYEYLLEKVRNEAAAAETGVTEGKIQDTTSVMTETVQSKPVKIKENVKTSNTTNVKTSNTTDEDVTGQDEESSMNTEEFIEQHNDLCDVCGQEDDLLMCTTCNLVFHLPCVRPVLTEMPSARDWRCAYCVLSSEPKNTKPRRLAASAVRLMARLRNQYKRKRGSEARRKDHEHDNNVTVGKKGGGESREENEEEKVENKSKEESDSLSTTTDKDVMNKSGKSEKMNPSLDNVDTGSNVAGDDERSDGDDDSNNDDESDESDNDGEHSVDASDSDNDGSDDMSRQSDGESSDNESKRTANDSEQLNNTKIVNHKLHKNEINKMDEKSDAKDGNSDKDEKRKNKQDQEIYNNYKPLSFFSDDEDEQSEMQEDEKSDEGEEQSAAVNLQADKEASEMSENPNLDNETTAVTSLPGENQDKHNKHNSIETKAMPMMEQQDFVEDVSEKGRKCPDNQVGNTSKLDDYNSGDDAKKVQQAQSGEAAQLEEQNIAKAVNQSESIEDCVLENDKTVDDVQKLASQNNSESLVKRSDDKLSKLSDGSNDHAVSAKSDEMEGLQKSTPFDDKEQSLEKSAPLSDENEHPKTPLSSKKRNLALYKIADSFSPAQKIDDTLSGGRGKRSRRQPTLFDPQVVSARMWQSDELRDYNAADDAESISTTNNIALNVAPKEVDEEVDMDGTIQHRRTARGDAIWCNFCLDDPNIKICCFCACRLCFGKHNQNKLLLCDMCDEEYHTFCLDPPLDVVPASEKWYCPPCTLSLKNADSTNVKTRHPNKKRKENENNMETELASPQRVSLRVVIPTITDFSATLIATTPVNKGILVSRKKSSTEKRDSGRKRGRPAKSKSLSSSSPTRSELNSGKKRGRPSSVSAFQMKHDAREEGDENQERLNDKGRKKSKKLTRKEKNRIRRAKAAAAVVTQNKNVDETLNTNSGDVQEAFVAPELVAASPTASTPVEEPVKKKQTVLLSRSGRTVKRSSFHDEKDEGEQHLRSSRISAAASAAAAVAMTVSGGSISRSSSASLLKPDLKMTVNDDDSQDNNCKKLKVNEGTTIPVPSIESVATADNDQKLPALLKPSDSVTNSTDVMSSEATKLEMVASLSVTEEKTPTTSNSDQAVVSSEHLESTGPILLPVVAAEIVNSPPAVNVEKLTASSEMTAAPAVAASKGTISVPIKQAEQETGGQQPGSSKKQDPDTAVFEKVLSNPLQQSQQQQSAKELPPPTSQQSADIKIPRRKPGARECMQMSRRFGARVISDQHMEILLDYCQRGKVEHLIRMRERLDDHARHLELQLAGLEALVKEKGESDLVVPAMPPKENGLL